MNGLYLLDLFVAGHAALHITLLLEPGADGLQGAIGTAPAIVIHAVLHIVVVAVNSLDHVYLKIRQSTKYLTFIWVFIYYSVSKL